MSAFRFFAFRNRMRFRIPFIAMVTMQFTIDVPPLETSIFPMDDRIASAVSPASSSEFSRSR